LPPLPSGECRRGCADQAPLLAVTGVNAIARQSPAPGFENEIASFLAFKPRKLAISKAFSPAKSTLNQPLGRFFMDD
jgi:hypothetical protein